ATELAGGAAICSLVESGELPSVVAAIALELAQNRTDEGGEDAASAALARIRTLLRGRGPTLIVLDDADGALGAAAFIASACAEAGAECTLLVTSRETLSIAGEHVVVVPPLPADAARELFVRLSTGGPWPPEQVEAWTGRVEGNPLAIELSARLAGVVSPEDLLARGDRAVEWLRTGRRDTPLRHGSIAAAVGRSLSRLGDDERAALTGLAMFEGPVALEAFEAIVGPMLEGDAVDALDALLRKSLATPVTGAGVARLALPWVVRACVRSDDRGAAAPSRAEAHERHAAFFLERALALAEKTYGAGALAALASMCSDAPNLLAAFERARSVTPARAARIAVAMADAAILHGAIDLHGPTLSDARDAADASGDDRLRALTRVALGRALLEIGRPTQAASVLAEAIALAETARDAPAAADARRSLAWAELALGRTGEAEALIEGALGAYAEHPNARAQADALAARGLARCLRGARAEGATDLEAAHAIHGVCEDSIRQAKVAEMARLVGLALPDPQAFADPAAEAARLRASAEAHHAAGRLWREAIDLFRLADVESGTQAAPELRDCHLGRALAAATAGGIGTGVIDALAAASRARQRTDAARPPSAWAAGAGCRWLQPPEGSRIDLARHGSLRLVLDALVTRRIDEPGVATPASVLLEHGWPGERVRFESGMLRVYTAIRRLRAMGLERALETRDDGYLLSPDVPFERRSG
ncbi:MAG: hypothetical protein FWD17_19650, partial [Polyangiaceae bacterium]|nr:hypothetical protein [Polyangiaceae bacterium]